jgi:hypothetical protein
MKASLLRGLAQYTLIRVKSKPRSKNVDFYFTIHNISTQCYY